MLKLRPESLRAGRVLGQIGSLAAGVASLPSARGASSRPLSYRLRRLPPFRSSRAARSSTAADPVASTVYFSKRSTKIENEVARGMVLVGSPQVVARARAIKDLRGLSTLSVG